jgi:GNAT superfamily N-acetyltransferase
MDLGESGAAAIAAVQARAAGERDLHRRRIADVLTAHGVSADIESLSASALDHARVTLHFHPDRLIADGRTVAEALRDEGSYRSQFETGISNGGLTAHPGGDRDEWERRLFEGAYHAPPRIRATMALRPKYGGLNLAGFSNGPAPAFGSCALVLGRREAARTTFLFGDSSEQYEDIGTADACEPVLAALFERVAATGQMLGLRDVSVPELAELLSGEVARPAAFCRVADEYIETHTHGRISLTSDADALLLDPSYRRTPTATALLEAAERYGLSVRWHEGSQLTLATFPASTPVQSGHAPSRWEQFLLSGRAARLAARVIADHAEDPGILTAAAIGDATRIFLREPGDWAEWGAPDPSLTVFKDLWRILVVYGTAHSSGAVP